MSLAMKMTALLATGLLSQALACSWTKEDSDAYGAAILIFSLLGVVFALVMTIVTSLPLCCGMCKAMGKIIAGIAIGVGILACFLPLIGGMVAAGSTLDAVCNRCGTCTDQERKAISDALGALGIFFAYFGAFGWLALILGIVASALGCCVCCKCCKMKDSDEVTTIQPVEVVGKPADE